MPQLSPLSVPPPAPAHAGVTDAEAAAMARAAVRLFARWNLTEAEACTLLGGLSRRSFARWKTGAVGRLPRDLRTRLSLLMGIHKALRVIFRAPERGYAWISAANASFGGRSARDVMLDGDIADLMRVRAYLDAERGGR